LYDPDYFVARACEEMPPSKKKRGQAARGQPASGGQLLNAVREGDTTAVARLLAAGADPNASVPKPTPSGSVVHTTALVQAAMHGRLEAARLLLDAGADPDHAGGNGFTPLMTAAMAGHLEVLRLLLGRAAAVDASDPDSGGTAFHCACGLNQAECAEALARAGCDVGLKTIDGQTGRELAEARGYAAVVTRLRAVVAEQLRAAQTTGPMPALEPAAAVGDGGPAAQLVTAATEGDGVAVARLLGAGADPNASVNVRTPSGDVLQSHLPLQTTALCEAARRGRLEAARLLLDAGADLDHADSDGCTALMAAAGGGHLEVLRLLLGRGAVVDAVGPGSINTAFHCACFQNHAECVEALVRAGCDVGINNGMRGLEIAVAQDSKDAVRRLRALARQPFVGVLVELAGLVGAAEHNGKRATVSEQPSRGHHTSAFLARARILSAVWPSIEERYVWQSNGGGIDPPPPPRCGARCCATCHRSSATRSSCWSHRPGVAARGSAWTCGRRTLCWRTCRPARGALGPGGCIGSRRCSPVFVKSAFTGLDSHVSNGPC
jgi:ankyrin repeat protein